MTEQKIGVACAVMVLKENRVLLGRRHPDRAVSKSDFDEVGCWCFPGGKLLFGESFEDCARRETTEECGIRIKNPSFFSITNDRNPSAHFATIYFLATEFEGEPKVMEPNKIVEWNWFALDNLPAPLFSPTKNGLNNYLNKKVYSGNSQ